MRQENLSHLCIVQDRSKETEVRIPTSAGSTPCSWDPGVQAPGWTTFTNSTGLSAGSCIPGSPRSPCMYCYVSPGPTYYSQVPQTGCVQFSRPRICQFLSFPECQGPGSFKKSSLLQDDLVLTPALLLLGFEGLLQERGQQRWQASLQPQEMASFCLSCFQPWLAPQQPVSSQALLTASLPVQVCFEFTAHLQIKAGRDIQRLRALSVPPHPAARYPLSRRLLWMFWKQGIGAWLQVPPPSWSQRLAGGGGYSPTTGTNPSSGA